MSVVIPSMSDRDGKIWMDGKMVEWRDAKIHVLSHTLHYGCGAFEGVRAYNTSNGTAVFRLEEHTERLFNSAKILRMQIPFSKKEIMDVQCEVVRANIYGPDRRIAWSTDAAMIGQRFGPVDVGLAGTEQIEVGAVQNENLHRSGGGLQLLERRH